MRLFKWLFLLVLLAIVVLPPLAALLAVQQAPLVSAESKLGPESIRRAEELLKLHDPRDLSSGEERALEITEQDLNVLGRYAFKRANDGSVLIDLQPGFVSAYLTWVLPDNPLGRYLNVSVDLTPASHTLHVDNFRVGELAIPHALAQPLVEHSHAFLSAEPVYQAILSAIGEVAVYDKVMQLVYRWDDGLVDQVKERGRDLLVSKEEVARVNLYFDAAEAYLAKRGGGVVKMEDLIGAMFQRAGEESISRDPVTENRAAIIALSLMVKGSKLGGLVGIQLPAGFKRPRMQVHGRDDFAQHFLISAGLAVTGDQGLADAVGLYKEIDDSQGGTGFSFTDLAADRAGVRFAERATESARAAKDVQLLLGAGPTADDIMPRVEDLPEFMTRSEFEARFGGVGAPAYESVASTIESRIDSLELHR